ncbi:MAG: hypothetical protein A2007_01855 [Verrucomicrobia bacterium GWC2_42_7]|nr:MAG: hypothetical protein A2007_01855 [Verrucomicrobia bacterium GWC2_42_7]
MKVVSKRIDKVRKPFFLRKKKGFPAFQRKTIVAKLKSIDFTLAKNEFFSATNTKRILGKGKKLLKKLVSPKVFSVKIDKFSLNH